MALARVQATPQVRTTTGSSIAVTFPATPAVGNGIVVGILCRSGTVPTTACTDNHGNTYTLARTQPGPSAGVGVDIYYCHAIAATGAGFTITATGGTAPKRVAVAVEVSGVGGGLVVNQSAGAETAATSGSAGPTPALTADAVFLFAALSIGGAGGTSIAVGTATPAWTQDAESIDTSASNAAGEMDSRVVTGVLGTPQSVTWALNFGATYMVGVLVAFAGSAPTVVAVPNVVGLTQAAATSALSAAGLAVGAVTTVPHPTLAVGLVATQTPAAGASVSPGSTVALALSSGPAVPPAGDCGVWSLATAADRLASEPVRRFDPRFWTTDFPRPMMSAVRTIGTDTVRLDCVFYTRGDLTGLIWESADRWDHVLIAYATNKNYAGTTLSFRWRSSNLLPIDQPNGTTLTIEGRDSTGAAHTWFVRLSNYAVGTPTDAVITLNFDALHDGWLADGVLVYPQDIDRMFLSAVPTTYLQGDTTLLATPVEAWGEISALVVTGPSLVLYTGAQLASHAFRPATGYDDSYNLTPERLLRNIHDLGWRGTINHYVGMSHYFRLANSGGTLLATTTGGALNTPATFWHQDFFARAHALGYEVIVATSYELFNTHTPEPWKQRDSTGAPALTGWDPPSTLLSPTNTAAMGYLQAVALAFAQLAATAGLTVRFQVGEPWWWVDFTTPKPYFYDASATALYLSETGLTAPVMTSMAGTKTATERAFLDWLGGKLHASTHALKTAVQTAHAGTVAYMLFYAPQVLNTTTPDLYRANRPAGWNYPEWDVFQLEDYDFVIDGNTSGSATAASTVTALMGYPVAQQHYFSGFVLNASDAAMLWPLVYNAAVVGLNRGVAEVFIWAMPQVIRDGWTVQRPLVCGWRVTIDGEDRTAIVDALSVTAALNERDRASITLSDVIPDKFAEVISFAKDGVTRLFGGVVLTRSFTGRNQYDATFQVALECGDFFTFTDWAYTTVKYDLDVTLKAVLQDLVTNHLGAYGITLDPAQVTGPTLAPFTWNAKRISDAMRELSDRTGYVARITPYKVLIFIAPGSEAGPVTITEAAPHIQELSWTDTDQTAANKVTVVAGPGGQQVIEDERHYGDGSTRVFPLYAPFVQLIGDVHIASLPGGWGLGMCGIDHPPDDPTGDYEWCYDASQNAIRQRADQPMIMPGDYVRVYYYAQFPFQVSAATGDTPVIEHVETRPEVLSIPVAQELANSLLAQFTAQPRELLITTDEDGFLPGQIVTVDLPTTRSIAGAFLLTEVAMTIVQDTGQGDAYWQYQMKAIESDLYAGSYLDAWRQLTSGGGGGGTSGGGGVGGSGMLSPHALTHGAGGSDPLQLSAASRLFGRGAAAGGGAVQEITLGTGLTMAGTVLAETPYRDLIEGAYTNPAADIARVYALDVNGYTQVEMKDSAGRGVRFSSDNVIIAKITEPAGVARGQAVYIAGASGANSLVRLAKADNIATMPVIGIVLDAGAVNAFTRVLAVGTLQGVNTSAFVEGVSLFVSPTVAGAFTDTLPTAPNYAQRVGFVTRSHATQGEILVLTTGVLADPRLHHATHETGGTDALTALAGGVITTGTVADARLSSNVPLKNVANTFAQPQTFDADLIYTDVNAIIRPNTVDGADNKSLLLAGGGSAAGIRGAYIWVRGNEYSFQPASITLAPGANGQTIVTGGINERGRTVPMGEWQAYAATITGAGVTVSGGARDTHYTLVGNTLIVVFQLTNITVTAGAGEILISLPFAASATGFSTVNYYTGSAWQAVLGHISTGDTIYHVGATYVAGTGHIWGTAIVPI